MPPLRSGSHAALLLLALALVVRLLGIDAPLIGVQAWRQTATASIARCYASEDRSLLRPAVDWRGTGPGVVESELPLHPWLVSRLYRLFGVHEAFGRLLSALFSVASLGALFGLVREVCGPRTALWALGMAAFLPLQIYYGRAFQPESLLLLGMTGGLWAAVRHVDTGSRHALALSAAGISLAALSKPTALFVGLPLLLLFWIRSGPRLLRSPDFYLYGAAVLAPVAAWYAHAHTLGLESGLSFGIWGYGSDKWGNWSLLATPDYWKRVGYTFLIKRHLAFGGFALFAIGLCLPRRSTLERIFDAWLLGGLLFLLLVARGSYTHEYYPLPVALPMLVFAAKALAHPDTWPLRRRSADTVRWSPRTIGALACLLAMLVASVDRMATYVERERPEQSAALALAARVREAVPPGALVVSATDGDPTTLYHADRRGWITTAALSEDAIRSLHLRGARALFGQPEPGTLRAALSLPGARRVYEGPAGFLVLLGAPEP